ncbi:MAG: murein L,D-transpeptidase catalytic domain family protein [Deltaproteobacteria bacterium]|nr:murein L,D-transpeptidase catalytic domain family protein [Deltaproteobacteria bacterium]
MRLSSLALVLLLASSSPHFGAAGLKPEVLDLALKAAAAAQERGFGKNKVLCVIDYSLPSTKRRLWIFDLERKKLLFHELVAHGKGSGENHANVFSNRQGSYASSLGLFQATETYQGKHGYTLKLVGLEKGINHHAEERSIVIHGAWYVSQAFAKRVGRLGRSWGCPAVSKKAARKVIDSLKGGGLIFVYYPDRSWLGKSAFLN